MLHIISRWLHCILPVVDVKTQTLIIQRRSPVTDIIKKTAAFRWWCLLRFDFFDFHNLENDRSGAIIKTPPRANTTKGYRYPQSSSGSIANHWS